jgi:integrase
VARKRAKRGTGGITERPNGKFQAQFSTTEGGRRVRKSETFILKRDAEWWLREAGRGQAPDVDRTVEEYLVDWLRSRRSIRPSTRALYRSHIETHIVPALGRIQLTELQPRHVETFVAELAAKKSRAGKPLGPATIRGIVTTLRAALATGVRRRELPDNAAAGVETPEYRPEPVVGMTPKEAAALVQAVKGHWLEQLVRFLLGSGVRIGEALALDQRDIEPGFVRVRRPKTVPRAVPISADAAAALAEAIRLAPRSGPKEPVFYGPKTGDRLTREVATHALPRLLERAGVRRMTPHSLRHGTATLMLSAGTPMRVIAEQLGHANPAMTARVYAHVTPAAAKLALDSLDEAIRRR